MARHTTTPLNNLLTLLRRIVVLSVAAWGLLCEMPYTTLAIRLAVLWAVLYISGGILDLVLRRLTYHALTQTSDTDASSGASAPPSATAVERAR
jgi:hypothetical protein